MDAGNLKCPMCGAPVSSDSPNCLHCGTRLAAVACPSCFAMVFEGANFCAHCGSALARTSGGAGDLPCPRCKESKLGKVQLAETALDECAGCHGLWVDSATFDRICADRERQAIILGPAAKVARKGAAFESTVRYLRCPGCAQLMSRVNFARCSGVIVDVCRAHGIWFDRDELQRVIEFIRRGGLDIARQKEKAELESARRRLEAARNRPGEFERHTHHYGGSTWFDAADVTDVIVHVGASLFHELFLD